MFYVSSSRLRSSDCRCLRCRAWKVSLRQSELRSPFSGRDASTAKSSSRLLFHTSMVSSCGFIGDQLHWICAGSQCMLSYHRWFHWGASQSTWGRGQDPEEVLWGPQGALWRSHKMAGELDLVLGAWCECHVTKCTGEVFKMNLVW